MNIVYDSNVWFSLRYAIYYFWKIRDSVGKIAESKNNFQKAREAWIVAVALLGISRLEGRTWWVKVPEEDPPDLYAMTITPDENKNINIMDYREVEVMEITKYSDGTLVEEIKRKLKYKSYIKETGLVVYLRKDFEIKDMKALSKELSSLKLPIADVWVIGNTEPGTNKFILFSLLPEVQVISFIIEEEIAKISVGDRIKMEYKGGTNKELVQMPLTRFIPDEQALVL